MNIQISLPGASAPKTVSASDIDMSAFSISGILEGGKGGKPEEQDLQSSATPPASPPLPPLPPIPVEDLRDATFVADGVFSAAPRGNPVIATLKGQEMYDASLGTGRHAITCPWSHEHADSASGSAIYHEPTLGMPYGHFQCPHHGDERKTIRDVLDRLDIEPQRARCKPRIRLEAGEQNLVLAAAEYVLAQEAGFFQSNGSIVSVVRDVAREDVAIELVNEQMLAKALSGAADWEKYDGRSKGHVPCDPPVRIPQMLAKASDYRFLPALKGVARQPYFRATDRKLISRSGYDSSSGIYASFDEAAFVMPTPTRMAAEAALERLLALVEETFFATEVDRVAALSAMLTATVRSTLRLAPAVNITAAMSGSGKSYVAEVIGQFASSGQPLVMSYPANSEEASKAMLAALLQAPAVVLFDDMQGDWQPFGVMNRMLTSTSIAERILGSSRVVTASTNAFFMGTGNNVYPLRDLARRVMTIRLAPPSSAPGMIRYKGNPAAAMRKERESYVCDALTIIRAWQEAGRPMAEVPSIGSFGEWSDMCRQPLLWLGLSDPATSLIEQVSKDPDVLALKAFMEAWACDIGQRPVTVRKLIDAMHASVHCALAETVLDLPVVERGIVNPSKLGWYLKKNAERIVDGYVIRRVEASERTAWCVVPVENGRGR